MLRQLLWFLFGASFFTGGLVLGQGGIKADPGPVAAVLELLLW